MANATSPFAPSLPGQIWLVGAGPGDPDLLTIKALRLLQTADVVFLDQLVSAEILNLISAKARLVSVGKRRGDHSVAQSQIHNLMAEAALAGKMVVRLKGGDPFIFGRGGEEVEALAALGLEAKVVPGISAALGAAASAGIPLTHRDHARHLNLVTGHAATGGVPALDWAALAKPEQTTVIYMGVDTAPIVSRRLQAAGMTPTTPVAVIENASRTNQRTVRCTVASLAKTIVRDGLTGPAVLIIGDVAGIAATPIVAATCEVAA